MGVLSVVLLVFFIIVAFLLILLVLAQNEEGDSLGGIFAGGSASAFGSRSGNVLTRVTSVLGGLFLVLCLALALVNRSPGGTGVEAAGRQLAPETGTTWWEEDTAEETPEPAASDAAATESALPGDEVPEGTDAGPEAEESAGEETAE